MTAADPPPADPATAVVVVAHGSRAHGANDAHRAIVDALRDAVDVAVVPAFLELAEPSIPDAIDAAVADGAGTVLVLPYFLHPGRHLTEDLPRIVGEAVGRHTGATVRLLGNFGDDPALVALLAGQVRAATQA
jgi:sirohydrochlorin ferrochelatase